MKHNKKRNTAFIYEILTRELTKMIVAKDELRKSKIVSILKEYFGSHNILALELELYNALLETTNIQEKLAERILQETKTAQSSLDEEQIFTAQSQIIGDINKNLGKEVWNNFVPNFKSLASVSAIFNSKLNIKKKVLFEQSLVDKMSGSKISQPLDNMKSVDSLAYSSFIKKFNDKYGFLIQEQKDLLNRYITSFADDGFELRLYLNEELSRLKKLLQDAADKDLQPLLVQRVSSVVDYLDEFRRREFSDDDLNKILKTQELVQELAAQ